MAYENATGIGVYSSYGRRDSGGSVGLEHSQTSTGRLSISFDSHSLNTNFLAPIVLPRGAKFTQAVLRVDEIFTLTGTTPTVIFGGTAPATNGIVLTAAELGTVGTKTPASTGTGTWAQASTTGTTAAEKVTKTLGGTTPAVTVGAGKATLILSYVYKTKV